MLATSTEVLFAPIEIGKLALPNRIVMAPMTRSFSPGGIPRENVAAYYRRRAEGGVGLIITEGTMVPHPSAGFDPGVPHIYGEAARAGWRRVVNEVHDAGAKIFCQLWHVGLQTNPPAPPDGPQAVGPSMSEADIEACIEAYAAGAANAQAAGFDGVELHGAHGYLIDQFFWEQTNQRNDAWGGDLVRRTRFAAEAIRAVRRRVGPSYPVAIRISQWKVADYNAKLAGTPEELAQFLQPLTDAGVDIFHCSTRRFWDAEFEGSPLGFAGWVRKLTGKPAIAVGSVTLGADVMQTFGPLESAPPAGIDALLERFGRQEFDLVAVGRSLLANPDWARIVQRGAVEELQPFNRSVLAELR